MASIVDPITATLAPAIGLPSRLPVTLPVMGRCCAASAPPTNRPTHTSRVRYATIPPSPSWFRTGLRGRSDTMPPESPTRKPPKPSAGRGFSRTPSRFVLSPGAFQSEGPPETVKERTATSGPRPRPRLVVVLVLHPTSPDDARVVAAEDVHVHHPAEDPRQEPPARGGARLRRRARRLGAEHRPPVFRLGPALPLAQRRHAPVHVLVPARQCQRDAV